MNTLQAAVLGLLQGLTEFLPVSSSGHLILGSALLGLPAPGLSFSIMVHLGTALATVVMLRREIAWLLRGIFAERYGSRALSATWFLVVASVPGALVGVAGGRLIEDAFSSIWVASVGLIVTGLVLWQSRLAARPGGRGVRAVSDRSGSRRRPGSQASGEPAGDILGTVTLRRALSVGVAQAFAVVPGISRSGATIATGLLAGLSREDAARFSFLLSLPAVFGAALLDFRKAALSDAPVFSGVALTGAAIAFVSGVVALSAVFRAVKKGELSSFAYYCWVVGGVSLVWFLVLR